MVASMKQPVLTPNHLLATSLATLEASQVATHLTPHFAPTTRNLIAHRIAQITPGKHARTTKVGQG